MPLAVLLLYNCSSSKDHQEEGEALLGDPSTSSPLYSNLMVQITKRRIIIILSATTSRSLTPSPEPRTATLSGEGGKMNLNLFINRQQAYIISCIFWDCLFRLTFHCFSYWYLGLHSVLKTPPTKLQVQNGDQTSVSNDGKDDDGTPVISVRQWAPPVRTFVTAAFSSKLPSLRVLLLLLIVILINIIIIGIIIIVSFVHPQKYRKIREGVK